MNYRKIDQGGDLFSILDHQRQCNQRARSINRFPDSIDWESFRKPIEEILGDKDRNKKKGGRPPFDPVFMFKILILQKFPDLSSEATEYQIGDRFSFMNFLGLRPSDSIPDPNTLWDFRDYLDKNDPDGVGRLFLHFEKPLSHQGVIAREGSMVDASFVDAPRQRNTREQNHEIKKGNIPERIDRNPYVKRQKDLDGRWAKKNQETHYGYKDHAKVDLKTKLIMNYKSTSANVHDSQVWQDLLDEGDQVLLADSAYELEESEAYLFKECDCKNLIQYLSYRIHTLTQE